MNKVVFWNCPICGEERRTLLQYLSNDVCLSLACHQDFTSFKRYNLILNLVRCLGCNRPKCIKTFIQREEEVK